MAVLTTKIRSSTLIEVIIAMLIVLISLFIVLNIFMKTNMSANFMLRIRAHMLAEEFLVDTKTKLTFFDEKREFENIVLTKSIKPYEGSNKLKIIEIIAADDKNHYLLEKKEVIRIETIK